MSHKNFSSFRKDVRIYVRIEYGAVLEPVRNIQSNQCLKAQDKIFCFQDPPDQTKGDSHARKCKL